MPTIYTTCHVYRCPERIPYGKQCPVHGKRGQRGKDNRKSSRQRGYDGQWEKVRKMKLRNEPLCQCGCGHAATTVHHIKPVDDYPELRLVFDNLMSLARECHEKIHGRLR